VGLIRHNLPTIIVLTMVFGFFGCGVLWVFLWQRVGLARATLLAGMVAWTGLLFSVSLLPKRKFGGTSQPRVCDLEALPTHISGALTNERRLMALLLFVPLAILLVLAVRGIARPLLAGAILALPALIEGLQYLVPGLHRPCSSNDVYDAWVGLWAGFVVGVVALRLLRRSSFLKPVRARHRDPHSRPHPGDVVKVLWPPLEQSASSAPTLPPPTFVPSGAQRSTIGHPAGPAGASGRHSSDSPPRTSKRPSETAEQGGKAAPRQTDQARPSQPPNRPDTGKRTDAAK
jgi:hypothetical protein